MIRINEKQLSYGDRCTPSFLDIECSSNLRDFTACFMLLRDFQVIIPMSLLFPLSQASDNKEMEQLRFYVKI